MFGGGRKASLGTVEVLGSLGYLEDREKRSSFPLGICQSGGGAMGGSEVSVSPSLKAVQRRGRGCEEAGKAGSRVLWYFPHTAVRTCRLGCASRGQHLPV